MAVCQMQMMLVDVPQEEVQSQSEVLVFVRKDKDVYSSMAYS